MTYRLVVQRLGQRRESAYVGRAVNVSMMFGHAGFHARCGEVINLG
jgi:hypothetical protein